MTKKLYGFRPKTNHSFMIVNETSKGAALVVKAWLEKNMPPKEAIEFFAHTWEPVTLEVEEDDE